MTLNELTQVLAGCVGTFGFAVLFNIRGKRFLFAGLGGLLSWLLFVLLRHIIPSEAVNYFIVAMVISLYAEAMARILKTPTTTFITVSLIPLIPGGSLYYTMAYAFESDATRFLEKGLNTLELASALALGIIIATTATKIFYKSLAKSKQEKSS